ncbi:hypothetical protein LTR04_005811 [Oleoguttula sp. CCFEE 6159]|nr:hypothetical protein LTR04_005811 [Oleoguttula sp. CCFEE 6159]
MRTSRIARDTVRGLGTQSLHQSHSPRNRPARSVLGTLRNYALPSSLARTEPVVKQEDVDSESELSSVPSDIDQADENVTSTTLSTTGRKRKRSTEPPATTAKASKPETTKSKTLPRKAAATDAEQDALEKNAAPKKARRQPTKKVNAADGAVKVEPPPNWEKVYSLTAEMRSRILAPVDTMGCESLAEDNRSPHDRRFQTLVALMLSSQTKDTVTSVAMKNLQANLPGGFTLDSMIAVDPVLLDELIRKVGFHNNKTKYIKATALILKEKFNGDIPDTIEGMISLPGVGPKMAYLCMSAAWGRDEGIGVDVHVHRITNLWGWHKTRTPEETRAALEAWLPKDKWHDINHLLVGFGQTICLPVGRRCGECVLSKGLCPSAVVGKEVKKRVKKEVKVEEEDGELVTKEEVDAGLSIRDVKAEDAEDQTFESGGAESTGHVPDIEDAVGASRRRSSRIVG